MLDIVSGQYHGQYQGQIQRGGGGGGRGSGSLLKNHKTIGFPSNIDPDTLKITKLPSQHLMVGHCRHASETHFNGVSLAGR